MAIDPRLLPGTVTKSQRDRLEHLYARVREAVAASVPLAGCVYTYPTSPDDTREGRLPESFEAMHYNALSVGLVLWDVARRVPACAPAVERLMEEWEGIKPTVKIQM